VAFAAGRTLTVFANATSTGGPSLDVTFLAQWGSYFWPVLMVSDATVRPLPLAISIFQNQQPPEWGQVLAFGTMFIVPVLAVFLIFLRWFVASVSSSAIKG
jgi:multiple sugar transport system permease protein